MKHAESARVLAPAKLNLSLRVLEREPTGYHRIETLFCALDLADVIELHATETGISLQIVPEDDDLDATSLGPAAENLAIRAAELFAAETGMSTGVHIRLEKRIPAGAGLGGGSSDAAAVLNALNGMRGHPLAERDLLELGARLGSDVPFFLSGTALALGRGRGDLLTPMTPLDPAVVVLAIPPERVATGDAYAALAAARAAGTIPGGANDEIAAPRSWRDVAATAHNDFEAVIFPRLPRLGDLRRILEDGGASIARMTGSGSVVFGIFDDAATAADAAYQLTRSHPDVHAVTTRTAGAPIEG